MAAELMRSEPPLKVPKVGAVEAAALAEHASTSMVGTICSAARVRYSETSAGQLIDAAASWPAQMPQQDSRGVAACLPLNTSGLMTDPVTDFTYRIAQCWPVK